MKKFIKERNPFLLISFMVSVVVFLYISLNLISTFSELSNMTLVNENFATRDEVIFLIFVIIFLVFLFNASLFSMIGHIFKKKEYVVVSLIIVMIISFMCISFNSIMVSLISIIWCIISAVGLMMTSDY